MSQSLPPRHEVLVLDTFAEHATAASDLIASEIVEAIDHRGVARVALSGGTTPSDTYLALGKLRLPWQAIEWFWLDERVVSHESPRSNYARARRDLGLHRAEVPVAQVHRMASDPDDVARCVLQYEALLRRSFGTASAVAFDVVTIGVGEDGHIASLFPRTGDVGVDDRLVIAASDPTLRQREVRMSLTVPVIREARCVVVLARGAAKRNVVVKAMSPGSEDDIPARVLLGCKGRVVWLLDRAAAGFSDPAPNPDRDTELRDHVDIEVN